MGIRATGGAVGKFVEWLRRKYVPDYPPVQPQDYYKAWAAVMGSEEGRTIIAHLRYSLWTVAAERCPKYLDSLERVAMWQVEHDAKMKVLEDIVNDATKNRELMPKPVRKVEAPHS
jgi:hypothetical protein